MLRRLLMLVLTPAALVVVAAPAAEAYDRYCIWAYVSSDGLPPTTISLPGDPGSKIPEVCFPVPDPLADPVREVFEVLPDPL